MAYYITVAGGTLYQVSSSGALTALTLPSGVTLDSSRRARMAVLGRNVVIVNAGSRSLFVDPSQVVRPLILQPPVSACIVAASGTAGGYTGNVRARYSHIIKDPTTGALLAQSARSPISAASGAITAKLIAATGVAVSPDAQVTHRRLERTTTGPGSTYFPWIDIDGNTITACSDDLSDASLDDIAAPTELGTAPGMLPGTFMTLIVSWKNRLWGVGDVLVDTIRFSGDGLIYAWPAAYSFDVSPVGVDIYGITGLLPRRDELGIAKRNILWKVVGSSPSNFQLVKVIEGKGCYGPDTVAVIRDIAYFLGEDGVYSWGQDGVSSVSDDRVRNWFASDTYFNRAQFPNAFAKYNARYHSYELHLAAAGSSNIDRWVSYDITRKEWFGPHRTTAFTPTFGGQIVDSNNLTVPVIMGSNGYIYQQNQTAFNDDGSAITLSLIGKSHSGDAPDIQKIFNDLSILQKVQASAGGLAIGVAVGAYNQAVSKTFTGDARKSRQRFSNIGPGRNVRLEFTEATLNQGCELHGYEIPFGSLGRR